VYEAYFAGLRIGRETRGEETATVLRLAEPRLHQRPDHIVEIGPGTGHYTRILAERADRVTAVEPSPQMGAYVARRMAADGFRNVSVQSGAFPSDIEIGDVATGVLSVGVLNYVADLNGSLRTIARILRPGGWAVFSIPPDTADGRSYQRQERWLRRHCYVYSDAQVGDAAREAGLTIHEMETAASVTRVVLATKSSTTDPR